MHKLSNRTYYAIVVGVIAGLTCLAWIHRFCQDDAFITFRYSYNLTHGYGAVFNPGERVEGYTNFLWMLIVSLGMKLGADPVTFSYAVGLVLFAVTLFVTAQLALLLLNSRSFALVTIILLGQNYTFSCYATGGLETQLQTCLLVCTTYLTCLMICNRSSSAGKVVAASLMFALAVLTRMDSFLLIGVLGSALMISLVKERLPAKEMVLRIGLLSIPFAAIVATWLAWKLSYYGEILPNTFYVRKLSGGTVALGLYYLVMFVKSYFLLPLLILFAVSIPRLVRRERPLLLPLILIAVWCAYIVAVGGDFMEFRFMVPILPFLFIVISWMIAKPISYKWLQIGLAAFLIVGSVHHSSNAHYTLQYSGIESVTSLKNHVYHEREGWAIIGKELGRIFDHRQDVTIALTPAGAIPYYSRLRTIDMQGLNDKWIARHGAVSGIRPGHQRCATYRYLLERKADIIIGHPMMLEDALYSDTLDYSVEIPDHEECGSVRTIGLPVTGGRRLMVGYVPGNPAVDDILERNGWLRK